MGSAVTARCKCGLKARIQIGGGMTNFMSTCYFPCLCEKCDRIVEVNLFAVPFQCPKCKAPDPVPYDHPRLSGRPGDHVVAAWRIADQLGRELSLNDGEYKCPKCKNMTLRFSGEGVYWD